MDRLGRWWNATRQAPANAAGAVRGWAQRSRSVFATVVETGSFAAVVRGAWVVHEAAGWLALGAVLFLFSIGLEPGEDES